MPKKKCKDCGTDVGSCGEDNYFNYGAARGELARRHVLYAPVRR